MSFTFVILLLGISSIAHAQLDFGKLVNPGPLASPHSSLEGIKNCNQCHSTSKGVPDEKCLTCHKEIQQRIVQRKGFHARVTGNCISCHSDHKGADYDLKGLSRLQFDHTDTGWPLTGKHQTLACPSCHTKMRKNVSTGTPASSKTYLGNNSECKTCHKDPHQSRGAAFQKCYKCHDTSSWAQRPRSNFNHNKETKFAQITGAHATLACKQCHTNKSWAPLSMECSSCHKDPHDGKFGKTCENCHNTKSWTAQMQKGGVVVPGKLPKGAKAGSVGAAVKIPSGFDHGKTEFPLTGLHKAVTCKGCHGPVIGKMENFKDCVGCHQNPHGDQFEKIWTPKPCSSCHSTAGFKKLGFDHNQDSRFEIQGKHKQVKCASCHTQGKFRWLSEAPDCVVCHNDPHRGQFAKQTCASCHTYDGFSVKKFDHNNTSFPLVGKHQAVACDTCHIENKFKGISHECNSCHNDFHKGELGMECERCHSPVKSFTDVEFDHNRESKFRIDGQHVKNQCYQCHWNYKFKLGDFKCSTCHVDVHKGSFGPDCDRCHTTSGFSMKEGFHEFGSFRITGVHNKIDCVQCHSPKKPARARPMECATCHKDPHMGSLSNDCSTCHGQTAWMPTTFRHNQTGFELSGAHRFLSCDQCHSNRVFGGLPSECFFCHFKDFNASLPQHVGAPTTCNTCHYTFGFRPTK